MQKSASWFSRLTQSVVQKKLFIALIFKRNTKQTIERKLQFVVPAMMIGGLHLWRHVTEQANTGSTIKKIIFFLISKCWTQTGFWFECTVQNDFRQITQFFDLQGPINMFLRRDLRGVKLPTNLKIQKSNATNYILLLSLKHAEHFYVHCIAT